MHFLRDKNPGDRIRSYDFCPGGDCEDSYLEGVILRYDNSNVASLKFIVLCDYCNYIGRAGMRLSLYLHGEINDFHGRIIFPEHSRPKICLNTSRPQFFLLDDHVWVVSKKHDMWRIVHQHHPERWCTELPGTLNEEALWSALNKYTSTQRIPSHLSI